MPSAPRAPFSDHHTNDRCRYLRHFAQVVRDLIRLAAFLGSDPRVGSGSINETDDRQPEFGRDLHFRKSLAIPFRVSHAVIVMVTFLQISALVLPDKHHFVVIELGQPGEHGAIVAESAIAVQFDEFIKHEFDVVEGLRALIMPGDHHHFPGGEMLEDLAPHARQFETDGADRLAGRGGWVRFRLQGLEPRLEIMERSFKREGCRCRHSRIMRGSGAGSQHSHGEVTNEFVEDEE